MIRSTASKHYHYPISVQPIKPTIMPSPYRRQDNTRLSCLVRIDDKSRLLLVVEIYWDWTVLSSHVCGVNAFASPIYIAKWKLGRDKTKLCSHRISRLDKTTILSCLVRIGDKSKLFSVASIYWRLNNAVCGVNAFASPSCKVETGSRHDKTLFTPNFETIQNSFEIFCRQQSWLVAISVHTADTDKTKQDNLVLSASVVWTRLTTHFPSHWG